MQFKAKTLVIAIALLTQFILVASAQDESGFDFRKTKWGMSEAEVKASEGSQPQAGPKSPSFDNILIYQGNVANLTAFCAYKFVSNQLVETAYVFTEEHSNLNLYISDYNKIKEILTGKYGQPTSDRTVWKNNLYRDDPDRYWMAVAKGDLAYGSSWTTPTTTILLTLTGDNYNISMILSYQSINLKSLIQSKEKSSHESDF